MFKPSKIMSTKVGTLLNILCILCGLESYNRRKCNIMILAIVIFVWSLSPCLKCLLLLQRAGFLVAGGSPVSCCATVFAVDHPAVSIPGSDPGVDPLGNILICRSRLLRAIRNGSALVGRHGIGRPSLRWRPDVGRGHADLFDSGRLDRNTFAVP